MFKWVGDVSRNSFVGYIGSAGDLSSYFEMIPIFVNKCWKQIWLSLETMSNHSKNVAVCLALSANRMIGNNSQSTARGGSKFGGLNLPQINHWRYPHLLPPRPKNMGGDKSLKEAVNATYFITSKIYISPIYINKSSITNSLLLLFFINLIAWHLNWSMMIIFLKFD